MASYMVLFIFATVLFLIDARPFDKTWSGLKDYNHIMDYDADDEMTRFFIEQENKERQLRLLNQSPDVFFSTHQQRNFRQ